MTKKTIIIGYGNTLRSDDGFGPYVADQLEQRGRLEQVEFFVLQQLTPELAETLAQVDLAVFVDADYGAPPGEIVRKWLSPQDEPTGSLSHHLTPATLLSMSQALYGRAPRGFLLSAGAASFEMGESLSPVMMKVVPDAIAEIETLILKKSHERKEL